MDSAVCCIHVISLSEFPPPFQNSRNKNMKGTVSVQCYGGTLFIEQAETLSIFGVMPLCSVSEKERYSLQSRIRQESSVEVLCCWTRLRRAESSAHCCGFFSVTSDKDPPPLSGRAEPTAPELLHDGRMNRRAKTAPVQIGYHLRSGNVEILARRCDTAAGSTEASTTIASRLHLKLLVKISWRTDVMWRQRSKPQPEKPSLIWELERGGRTEILYLTPLMFQPVWKTAVINWLSRGIKPLYEAHFSMMRKIPWKEASTIQKEGIYIIVQTEKQR